MLSCSALLISLGLYCSNFWQAFSLNAQIIIFLCLNFTFENFICFLNFYFLKTLSINIFQAFPLLLADIDPSGNMNAQIIHGPTDRTRLKFMSQIMKKKWEGVQMSADYKGDTWTSSLTLANPDIVNGSGVGVLHYLKSVSKS